MNPSGIPANPSQFTSKLNEIYLLDVTGDVQGKKYYTNELNRFLAGPAGCETTGGRFTPDGSTYFVNIQHPSTANAAPYNHSVTLAITGYEEILTSMESNVFTDDADQFNIFPNPASREIHLSKKMDVAIYSAKGERILVKRDTDKVDVASLKAGIYVIQNQDGQSKKLIVQ
jgi:hypothetical protein